MYKITIYLKIYICAQHKKNQLIITMNEISKKENNVFIRVDKFWITLCFFHFHHCSHTPWLRPAFAFDANFYPRARY